MSRFISFDKKVILPRVRVVPSLGWDWEPPPWRSLKGFVHGDGTAMDWKQIYSDAKNARLTIPESKAALTREQLLQLKSMYVMLQEGYIVRDGAGRAATFRRGTVGSRISAGASCILTTPLRRETSHAAGIEKMRSALRVPDATFSIRPLGAAYHELTVDQGTFGPAYFWLLYEATCNFPLPRARQPREAEDSFIGMKNGEALLEGKVTVSGRTIQIDGPSDLAALRLLMGRPHKDPWAPIRRIQPSEFDQIPRFDKPLVEERVQKRLTLLGLVTGGGFLAWKAAEQLSNAEWITEKLTQALNELQSVF